MQIFVVRLFRIFLSLSLCLVIPVPADRDLFGDRLPNGSFTGALGRLVRREVDIVFTGFFMAHRVLQGFSLPWGTSLTLSYKKVNYMLEIGLSGTFFGQAPWKFLLDLSIKGSVESHCI